MSSLKSKGFLFSTALFFLFHFLILGLAHPNVSQSAVCNETNTVHADVVALDEVLIYNRQAAINPYGMIYALRHDVVDSNSFLSEHEPGGSPLVNGQVTLREGKRPRPLTLRVNAGGCLHVNFQNLLANPKIDNEQPSTRYAGMHVTGMQLVMDIEDDGSHVGKNPSSLAAPGATKEYTWYAQPGAEGTFLISSGPVPGGEGNGAALAMGLFGAVNVEPADAGYYRSQLTRQELDWALHIGNPNQDPLNPGYFPSGHPIIDYDAVYPAAAGPARQGFPIIKMLDANKNIIHSDLRAIIYGTSVDYGPNFQPTTYPQNPVIAPNDTSLPGAVLVGEQAIPANNPDNLDIKDSRPREEPFREFTIVFHDEIFAHQAYPAFEDPVLGFTLACCRDGFAINYGSGGIGAEVISNRTQKGPMWNCNECKYEEFFLTSWVVGDPAMVVDLPASESEPATVGTPPVIATTVLYPDDPSNVDHSYIGDHVKMRNLHAGPKEHHIFHLHAHQWLFTPDEENSVYLDSQALGPGSNYTYDIAYNGSGNRNQTVGDAIYHCHFYPHFAQGMWALWRNHDVFEMGTELDVDGKPMAGARAYPDGEIVAGTPIPAVVPIPSLAMAPMPGLVTVKADVHNIPDGIDDGGIDTREVGSQIDLSGITDINDIEQNPGYPFFIPALAGHRAPHPPLDTIDDGGLPRHVVKGGESFAPPLNRLDFRKLNHTLDVNFLAENGEPIEMLAMDYHGTRVHDSITPDGTPLGFITNGLPGVAGAPFADPCVDDQGNGVGGSGGGATNVTAARNYKVAGFQLDMVFNKLGEHYPQARMMALWGDVLDFAEYNKPPEPLFFRANSEECIEFHLTNLVPGEYKLDDYQVRTPTDVIGQHIHLVKFDVTSSDGSANGWNYEDAAFSPDEVVERIHAINLFNNNPNPLDDLVAEPHPYFGSELNGVDITGAQTIVQRWYADETMNMTGFDRTLRTVYTHDHYAPSTHQQVGYYAGLLVEPKDSVWRDSKDGTIMGSRWDGGPTSWRANIETQDISNSYREFMFEFADFALGYEPDNANDQLPNPDFSDLLDFMEGAVPSHLQGNFVSPNLAINPSGRIEVGLPTVLARPDKCPGEPGFEPSPPCPEGVSHDDPGSFVVNYRNESIVQRVRNPDPGQKLCVTPVTGEEILSTSACDLLVVGNACEGGAGICVDDHCMPASLVCLDGNGDVIENPLGCLGLGDFCGPTGVEGTCQANPAGCQTRGLPGDLSHVFRSDLVRANPPLNSIQGNSGYTEQLTPNLLPGDPFTPLLETFQDDRIQLRFMVGAHEEGHVESFFGVKWLLEPGAPDSGWRNAQTAGISEHFEFEIEKLAQGQNDSSRTDYLYTFDTASDGFAAGVWGLMRVFEGTESEHLIPGSLYPLPNNSDGEGPGNRNIRNKKDFAGICPKNAPERKFDVWAVKASDVVPPSGGLPGGTLVYNSRTDILPINNSGHLGPLHDPTAMMYVQKDDLDLTGKLKAGVPIEPLILRANAGDCILMTLTNKLPEVINDDLDHFSQVPMVIENFNTNEMTVSNHVGIHTQRLAYDVLDDEGANIGMNVEQAGGQTRTVKPNETIEYKWYAGDIRIVNNEKVSTPVEFGSINLIPSDPIEHSAKGLVGGLIIEPEGATWVTDPHSRAQATVTVPGDGIFREFVLIFQDDIQLRDGDGEPICPIRGQAEGDCSGVEDAEDSGNKAVNYRSEPLWFRHGESVPGADFETTRDIDFKDILANSKVGGDPETPVFTATKGTPVRFRLLQPGGHPRNGVFEVHGHIWQREPYQTNNPDIGSEVLGDNTKSEHYGAQAGLGPMNHFEILLENGAGGPFEVPGDYLWRNMASFQFDGGQWGIFRVCNGGDQTCPQGGPPPAQCEVPRVIGMSQSNAITAIESAGLILGSIQDQFNEAPKNEVVDQQPGANTELTCGGEVNLVVSLGPETCTGNIPVPYVVGESEANAISIIGQVNLTVGTVTHDFSDTVPAGYVISQNPDSGNLACDSPIDLVISDGPAPGCSGTVPVPDVVGQSEASATSEIEGAGLTVGTVTSEYHPSIAAGNVISSNPNAGTDLDCGLSVDLILSDGPEPICIGPKPDGDSCVSDEQCCSGKCRGKTGQKKCRNS